MSAPQLDINPEHLVTLYDITRTINASLEFDQVLNSVMDSIMQCTKAQRGFLMVADEDGHLRVRVARGLAPDEIPTETPYSTTIVDQVVETRQSLLTNNAQFDERYKPGESIIMRGLRAILCAPMLVNDRLVGVVYVDTSMRTGTFNESDLQLLNAVAGQAGISIENARLYRVAIEKGRMERELQVAREIQETLLPRSLPLFRGYEIAARWRSAREVAGDFYDVFGLDDGALGLVVADVSDKGAPAALFMAAARSMIRSYAFMGMTPMETLHRTNELILEDADSGMFVTVVYTVFDRQGRGALANAGHNPPLVYRRADRSVQFLPRGGRAIGWFPNNPLGSIELQLEPGDVIVFYTDGLTDTENAAGEDFGSERLAQMVANVGEHSADIIMEYLLAQVDAFAGDTPAFDDLTLCVLRYTGR